MSTVDSPGLTQFELGELIHPKQRVRPTDDASAWEWKLYEWPDWCQRMKKILPAENGAFYVPPLLRWWKDPARQVEYFDIGLPGAFDGLQPRQEIPAFLKSSVGAEEAVDLIAPAGQMKPLLDERGFGDMPVMRVVLSYFRLPDLDPFDLSKIPESRDQFYLGSLMEGSDLIWETAGHTPHGLLVGLTRSGKSETAASIAAQAWKKGWRVIVISPTTGDPTFLKFAELSPDDVVLGSTDEDYEKALRIWRDVHSEMDRREAEKAQHRCNTWGMEMAGVQWVGRPTLIITDECGDFFEPDGSIDSEVALRCKKEIRSIHARIAAKGAKARLHLLDMTQEPTVDTLGGGKALRNLGFRVAVRALDPTWFPTVFPNSKTTHVPQVLTSGATPQGRAVARGALAPKNEFGGKVDDTPVQLAYFDQEAREAWLDEGRDETEGFLTPVPDLDQPDDLAVLVEPPAEVEFSAARPDLTVVSDPVDREAAGLDPAATPPELTEPTVAPPEAEEPIPAPAEWVGTGRRLGAAESAVVKVTTVVFVVVALFGVAVWGPLGVAALASGVGGLGVNLLLAARYGLTPLTTPDRKSLSVRPGWVIAPAAVGTLAVFAVIVLSVI